MAENVYEGLFILDSNAYARDPRRIAQQIDKLVQDQEGEMLVSRLWTEQKLAYPIKGHRKGTYWLAYFRLDGSRLAELNQQCKLLDVVLRSLVIKLDPRLVDAIVEHARTGGQAAAPEAEAPEKSEQEEKKKETAEAK